MAQCDNPKTSPGRQHRHELASHQSTMVSGQTFIKFLLPNVLTHIFFHSLNMVFGRNSRHALHCRRHSCRHLKKMPDSRRVLVSHEQIIAFDNVDHQQLLDCVYIAIRLATIFRWRRAKFHFRQQECKGGNYKTEVVHGEIIPQHSSITIWPTIQHRRRSNTPMT